MASTSCAMISGRSGFPKLRLLVAATGIAPTAERLRQHSATMRRAPSRGRQQAPPTVAVERHRDGSARFLDPDDGGVGAWTLHGVGAHHVVVLFPDPALGANVGRGDEGFEIGLQIGARERWPFHRHGTVGRGVGPVVERRFVGELTIGNLGDHDAAIPYAQHPVRGDFADANRVQPPLAETRRTPRPRGLSRPPAACAPAIRRA